MAPKKTKAYFNDRDGTVCAGDIGTSMTVLMTFNDSLSMCIMRDPLLHIAGGGSLRRI